MDRRKTLGSSTEAMKRTAIFVLIALFSAWLSACADTPKSGKNWVNVRGQMQEIYYYPAVGSGSRAKVLFAPGDGGWRGFAVEIAEHLQRFGYDVYGLDTRHYLQSFTGGAVLSPRDIASDFRQISNWIRQGGKERVLLAGWSEGAGLGLAAAADPQSKTAFDGMLAIGLTENNILAWRWSDTWAEIAKRLPNEPTFPSSLYIGQVAPLPLFMIASAHDEYITPEATRALYALAQEPKRLAVIDAADHKFGGNTDAFFRTLQEGLAWIAQQHK